nr:DUF5060 domain-containing protein [Rubripirellula amarantea]
MPSWAGEAQRHIDDQTIAARQWDVIDIQFNQALRADEGTETEFSATFSSDDGDQLEIPGFFDGQNGFVLRFTPPKPGSWKYVTRSSSTALDKKSGEIAAEPAASGRRGSIVVNENSPRQFHYQDGEAYYPIAFEFDWLFALDAENPTDIPLTRQWIDRLAENGFNQVVMNVFAYDVNWQKDDRLPKEYDYGNPRVFPFGGDNTHPDHSKLNIEYFQRLDRVIDYLDQKGIAAHLMIYVWNKKVNWPEANSDADNRYFDYVVKRYQAFPNLIWDISKEALGYGHNDVNYISQRIERLRKLDAYRRLVTVHDYSYCRRFPNKLDFISVQLWHAELYGTMRNVVKDFPGKPILNIEHGGYEDAPYVVFPGSYVSPETCLERAYQCVFAGTYPTHYWQNAAWNVIIPDVESLAPDDRPRLDYYRHLRTLVEKYRLGELIAGDTKCNSGFCLHNDDDLFVFYVPKENISIGPRLPKDAKGRKMKGTWFDPFTGTFSEPVEQTISQWPSFRKPEGDGFSVLVVDILPDNTP